MNEDGTVKIDNSKCISCGACVYQCPFGALSDKSFILDAIKMLKNCDRVYAVVAPADRQPVHLWQSPARSSRPSRLSASATWLEAALGADMVAYNEAAELAERGFLTSSCCPGLRELYPQELPGTSGEYIAQYVTDGDDSKAHKGKGSRGEDGVHRPLHGEKG